MELPSDTHGRGDSRGSGDPRDDLRRLAEGRPCVRRQGHGDALRVEGADALDLLHRLAATTLLGLTPGQRAPALFTDDKGRVIDLAHACRENDAVLLITGGGRAEALRGWIERYIITENARCVPLTAATVLTLVGEGVRERAARALGKGPLGSLRVFVGTDTGEVLVPCDPGFSEQGHLMVSTPSRLPAVLASLAQQGVDPVGERAYREWWIRGGRLGPGPELASGVNPLEAGLRRIISWDKGCYIGQEVVARLDTYEKVKRRVAVLQTDASGDLPENLLDDRGHRVGRVLASTRRLDGGGTLGLVLLDHRIGAGTLTWDGGAGTVLDGVPVAD